MYMEYYSPMSGPYSGNIFCVSLTGSTQWNFWCHTQNKGYITGFGVAGTTVVVPLDCDPFRCARNSMASANTLYELTCGEYSTSEK